MAKTIVDQRTENLLLTKIQNLERIINDMKSNQSPTLLAQDGSIVVDQAAGTITFKDSLGNILRIMSGIKDSFYDGANEVVRLGDLT